MSKAVHDDAPPEIIAEMSKTGDCFRQPTECAHILPPSLLYSLPFLEKVYKATDLSDRMSSRAEDQLHNSARILNTLRAFGYRVEAFIGPSFHSLQNVLTLERSLCDWFSRLILYFEKEVSFQRAA